MELKGVFMRGQGYSARGSACVGVFGVRLAQDIGVGLIVPLSAPGDATGGQLIRRGAEIGVDMINAQGGVLGKKLKLFVQDSQGKPEAGVAGYRRLVSEDKVVAVPGFFHSSVDIAVNEVAKEMGVPTIAVQASAARHHRQALRHRLPHPRGRSGARRDLDGVHQEEGLQARLADRRDHRLRHRPRRRDRGADQDRCRASRSRR